MDNKFRFKDVLLTVLLLVIIVMMALKMVQDDRQWENFERIQTKLDEQTRDMTALRKAIAGGIAVNPAGGESNPSVKKSALQASVRSARRTETRKFVL